MLRRSITVFLILAIVISVCVPAFAAPTEVNIWEYAEISVDGLTKKVVISFPDSFLQTAILDSGLAVKYSQDGNVSGFDLSAIDFANGSLKVAFAPLGTALNPYYQGDYSGLALDMSDLPNGSVLSYSVSAEMQAASGQSFNVSSSMLSCWYYSGLRLIRDYTESVPFSVTGSMYNASVDYVLTDNSKPFVFQHLFAFSTNAPESRWIFRLDEFTITTSIDALQELVDATGETNRLLDEVNKKLDEITDRPPDPEEPTWGESAGDAEQKEDQIIDQLDPDKVTNDLADMHLTLVDNLLLYTNAFAAISAIWVVLIDLPFIKIILYCSLLFGLLAAFLGMGLAAGRASDRHSGRSSGKKGK